MTVQVIINTAQSIEFDRRRVVGQSISRSQRIKTAERLTAQPFVITVTPLARFRYEAYRPVLEGIMSLDRTEEQAVNIANKTSMNYLTSYLGDLTDAQLSGLTITNFTATTVTIGQLPTIGASDRTGNTISSTSTIFEAGDWIQPTNSRYPYIVSEAVLRTSGSTTTATVHRPLISSENIVVTGPIIVGTATTIRVLVSELPNYRLVQKDWCEFTGDFVLVEKVI
jgi:hypothetical protein